MDCRWVINYSAGLASLESASNEEIESWVASKEGSFQEWAVFGGHAPATEVTALSQQEAKKLVGPVLQPAVLVAELRFLLALTMAPATQYTALRIEQPLPPSGCWAIPFINITDTYSTKSPITQRPFPTHLSIHPLSIPHPLPLAAPVTAVGQTPGLTPSSNHPGSPSIPATLAKPVASADLCRPLQPLAGSVHSF
ncbi:hypothetical protein BGZ63DRAFT_431384 [Mariannaea sp. PMI_226]|nr:hypothetical protein BGZ63DRAFT_431384 [Mariannaea sp. PMI_226]